MGDTRMWHWTPSCPNGRVWVSLDTGSSVPKTWQGHSPGKGRHSHGPCGAHSKIHVSPTGITCSQHPACSVQCCPGTPRIPGIPSPATSPKATPPSALGASVWLLPCPLGAPKSLQAVRTQVGISPPSSSSPWKTGRFEKQAGGLQPPQTHTHRVGKKGSRLGSFPKLLLPQPNPFGHSPNPTSSGPGISHSGQDTVPTAGLGVSWSGGKGLPTSAPCRSRCRVGTARPKRAGSARRGLGHNVTAAAATEGHSDSERKSRARPGPGPGGPLAPHSPGVAAIRKNLEALARPAEARDRSRAAWKAGPEGGEPAAGRKTRRDLCAEQPRQGCAGAPGRG